MKNKSPKFSELKGYRFLESVRESIYARTQLVIFLLVTYGFFIVVGYRCNKAGFATCFSENNSFEILIIFIIVAGFVFISLESFVGIFSSREKAISIAHDIPVGFRIIVVPLSFVFSTFIFYLYKYAFYSYRK